MRVKVVKPYGNFKKGDELTRMHPDTAKTLVKKGLVEVVNEETKKGGGPDDFFQPMKK